MFSVREFDIISFIDDEKVITVQTKLKSRERMLTSRSRQNHVRELGVGSNLCDPSIVATEGSSKFKRFAVHFLL